MRFRKRFKLHAFDSLVEALKALRPEVIAVATPTDTHAELFYQCLKFNLKAIILEKPMGVSAADGIAIASAANKAETVLLINYVRRFEPGTAELKHALSNGFIGDVYKGRVIYSRIHQINFNIRD